MSHITLSDLKPRLEAGSGNVLLDVRTPAEFEEVHAEGAILLPLDQLSKASFERVVGASLPQGGEFLILCRSGARAERARLLLEAEGIADGVVVEGGTLAWIDAALPVVRGTRRVLPLERQVRIAAGSLVLVGSFVGFLVHPAGFGLCAFVGAGLVFAGLTDWCGMGLLLAKAPWNRSSRH